VYIYRGVLEYLLSTGRAFFKASVTAIYQKERERERERGREGRRERGREGILSSKTSTMHANLKQNDIRESGKDTISCRKAIRRRCPIKEENSESDIRIQTDSFFMSLFY
jgi:hypothetical protein